MTAPTRVIRKEFAEYTVTDYGDEYGVDIRPLDKRIDVIARHWILVRSDSELDQTIERTETKLSLLSILSNFTQEMEGYVYYGSNPGISVDDFDDVADAILKQFGPVGE